MRVVGRVGPELAGLTAAAGLRRVRAFHGCVQVRVLELVPQRGVFLKFRNDAQRQGVQGNLAFDRSE